MVELVGSDAFSQGSFEEKEDYTIDGIVEKLKGGQTLSSDEIVWFSRQITKGGIDWSAGIDNSWIDQLLPQLKAEMEKSVKEGESSRDLRDSDRDDLFKVSQTQRRARGKGGQLWYQEIKQRNAEYAAKEANSTLFSRFCLEHMKIKKELPEGVNLDDVIKEQREASNISGWRHPMKKLRSRRTLKSLENLQAQISSQNQQPDTAAQTSAVDTAAIENKIKAAEDRIATLMNGYLGQSSKFVGKGDEVTAKKEELRNNPEKLKELAEFAATWAQTKRAERPAIPEEWSWISGMAMDEIGKLATTGEIASLRAGITKDKGTLAAAQQAQTAEQPKKANGVQTFLDSISNGGTQTPSLWTRIRHPQQSRKQSKELERLLDTLPSSELAADGRLMKGINAEIQRLEGSLSSDKKKNKEIKSKIQKLKQYKGRIAEETKQRNDKFSKRQKELETQHGEHLKIAKERFNSSAKVTHARDELLQGTTLFSKTLEKLALNADGEEAQKIISELQTLYRKQIKDDKLDEAMAGLTPEQQQILAGKGAKAPESEDPQIVGEAEKPQEQPEEEVDENDKKKKTDEHESATIEAQQEGKEYTPLKDIKYTHQVEGQSKEETYSGEAVSHSEEENRYAIDLDKAQGEELDKACMATLAHMKENGQTSFKIDENTPVELYDSLVKAAEASGMTIENEKELETVMAEKRKQKDESHEGDAKKEESTLTPEQQAYLVGHKLLKEDMTMEQLGKLKWSDLDEEQQKRLNGDGLGQENDGARRTEPKDRQSEKTEPQTEQEQLLAKSEALKGIRSAIGTFDQETQRYKMSSEADFQEKIADLSPAEQRAAREIRGLQMKENTARDKAAKSGEPFDKKKEEEFARSQGVAWGRAYENIKKERGITPKKKEVKKTTLDPQVVDRGHTNS